MRFRTALVRKILGVLGAIAMLAGAAAAAPAPQLRAQSLSDLGTDLPYPFDPDMDANRAVADATARAAASGKLLLLDFGGNWCPDCRILAAVMELPEMKAFLQAHYVVVPVDVGMMNKNLQIPARFGVTKPLQGVPTVLIVDPKTGALVNNGHIEALVDARSLTPQAIADWLAKWTQWTR